MARVVIQLRFVQTAVPIYRSYIRFGRVTNSAIENNGGVRRGVAAGL
jgi:hypothetical protein